MLLTNIDRRDNGFEKNTFFNCYIQTLTYETLDLKRTLFSFFYHIGWFLDFVNDSPRVLSGDRDSSNYYMLENIIYLCTDWQSQREKVKKSFLGQIRFSSAHRWAFFYDLWISTLFHRKNINSRSRQCGGFRRDPLVFVNVLVT